MGCNDRHVDVERLYDDAVAFGSTHIIRQSGTCRFGFGCRGHVGP